MRWLLAMALVLTSSVALSGWRSVPGVTATNDLLVVDAGMIAVATATGAQLVVADADGGFSALQSLTGAQLSVGVVSNNCLVGFGPTTLAYSSNCTVSSRLHGIGTPVAMRAYSGDTLALLQVPSVSRLVDGHGNANGMMFPTNNPWFASPVTAVLRTARVGNVDFLAANQTAAGYVLGQDGGSMVAVSSTAALTDLSVFSISGVPAVIGVGGGGLLLHPDARLTGTRSVTIPLDPPKRVAMGLDQGMASTVSGQMISPVPDVANYPNTWRLRPDAGVTWGNKVHCLESRWCAATDTSNQVWLYENTGGPQVSVAPVRADAGSTIRLQLDAGDPDGDPLFHAWTATGAMIGTVAGLEDGKGIDLTLPSGAACGAFPVSVRSTDGLFSVTTTVDVQIVGRGDLITPAPTAAAAAGPPVRLTAGVDGGCDSATFTWVTSDAQSGTGATFDFIPPPTWCGGAVSVTVNATWSQGMPTSESRVLTVPITGWGAPNAPFFPAPALQASGTRRVWSPTNAEHVCGGAFPGTFLEWDPIDAGPALATIVDGGLELDIPSLCAPTQIVASSHRRVIGTTDPVSDAGTLTVDVSANIVPLDSMTPFMVTAAADAGIAFGDTSLLAACRAQRALESEVEIFDGTQSVALGRFVPGSGWSLPVPGGCNGGTRDVVARLFEDAGFTGAQATATLTLDTSPARVGSLTPTRALARCGTGVVEHVDLVDVPGSCSSAQATWRSVNGPALESMAGPGRSLDLQTVARDFSPVGQTIDLEWTLDAGSGNAETAIRSIEVTVEPFVTVASRTFPVVLREDSAFDVEVLLGNTTDCGVDGLEVVIPLTSGTPLDGSVLIDGVRHAGEVVDGSLVLRDVSLNAQATASVRFAARPRLLGSPSATPTVTLRSYPVGLDQTPRVAPAGCGCGEGGAGLLTAVALLLFGRRRTQRV